jgi:hypothetical protein
LSKSLRREIESGVRLLIAKAGNKTLFWELGPSLVAKSAEKQKLVASLFTKTDASEGVKVFEYRLGNNLIHE